VAAPDAGVPAVAAPDTPPAIDTPPAKSGKRAPEKRRKPKAPDDFSDSRY
jgi:hypothetical protein